jgi:hypothetical protein
MADDKARSPPPKIAGLLICSLFPLLIRKNTLHTGHPAKLPEHRDNVVVCRHPMVAKAVIGDVIPNAPEGRF